MKNLITLTFLTTLIATPAFGMHVTIKNIQKKSHKKQLNREKLEKLARADFYVQSNKPMNEFGKKAAAGFLNHTLPTLIREYYQTDIKFVDTEGNTVFMPAKDGRDI